MSYSVLKNNTPDGKPEYVADSAVDLVSLKDLNPPMGTSCLVLSEDQVYVLNSFKDWIQIGNSASGEGGSTIINNTLNWINFV